MIRWTVGLLLAIHLPVGAAPEPGLEPGLGPGPGVEAVPARYRIEPRRTHHRERRWNHAERIRRLSHSVFRALEETGGREPANRIAEDILGAFSLAPGGVEEIG